MASQRSHSNLVFLVVLGVLLTTSAGRAFAAPLESSDAVIVVPALINLEEDDSRDDEEDSGGSWYDPIVDTGGDILGGAKDVIVDTAGDVWNVVEDTPGAVWDFVQGIPGAIGRMVTGGWQWLRNGHVELEDWREFLDNHPLMGAILGPIVELLIGIAPDGTISFLEILVGVVAFALPGIKGIQNLWKNADNLLPWVDDVGEAVGPIRRNPGGFFNGVADTYRLSRAKAIKPTGEDFAILPSSPGVYVAVDASGKPLYVGMSNSLSRRVPEHFDSTPSGFASTTDEVKILPTKSVTEARTLECTLIKSYMPHHNTIHKNDKPCPDFPEAAVPVMP